MRAGLQPLSAIPEHAEDPDAYTDWGDLREFGLGDLGVGECAGEVISTTDFGLAESEREVFEAQLELDRGELAAAARGAYRAMLTAARAVTSMRRPDLVAEEAEVVDAFKGELYDTKLFFDPFAGPKFARFLFAARDEPLTAPSVDSARQRLEEAQLFIEAAHACYSRLAAAQGDA